jgi:hypothetical protein
MIDRHHSLIAYLSTLFGIVILVVVGAWIAVQGHSTEALGIGGAVTGLIGVLGTFRPRNASAETNIGDVSVNEVPPPKGEE